MKCKCVNCGNAFESVIPSVYCPDGLCRFTMKATRLTYRHTCLRCGVVWNGNRPNPVACPRCKTTLWNTPRKRIMAQRQMTLPMDIAGALGAALTPSSPTTKLVEVAPPPVPELEPPKERTGEVEVVVPDGELDPRDALTVLAGLFNE